MFYTIYKTTNLINGKYYIGKHQTENLNDGYFGSGKLLKRAIKKYGIENFVTDILFIYDEEWKMNLAERILVVPDSELSYNLCPGGQGGFGYINDRGMNTTITKEGRKRLSVLMVEMNSNLSPTSKNSRAKKSASTKKASGKLYIPDWNGRTHSEETKCKMSLIKTGEKNSQFGTYWVTNGKENKKIKKEDIDSWISKGYRKGRT